eukprot:TRINITY_DN3675_c0_g1_i1.p1 TRINITY_DN3675_c0_g1~~TRINITY_DN3675_c0_g1_i1.p1  ORF type:complete len:1144 (-),score=367.23 TRINITY_DN3675_c0_g1_i1:115-3546(-)
MVLAMLAVAKAGAAFMMMDPAYPKDRIQYMLNDAQAHVIISESAVLSSIDLSDIKLSIPEEKKEDKRERERQERRDERKREHKSTDEKKGDEKRSEEKKEERKGEETKHVEERKGEEKKREEKRGEERKGEEKKGEEKKGEEKKGEEKKGEERKGEEKKAEEKKDGGARVSSLQVVVLDQDWANIKKCPAENLRSSASVQGTDLMYVVYTSGSTGRPKGVMINHISLTSMAQWHAREYKHTPADRESQMIAPAFDPVMLEIWPFLTIGASIQFMPDHVRASPPSLMRWLVDQRITAALFATPVAETVIHEVWPANTALKFITAGGDKLHRGPRHRVPFRFDNHYGPSENTVITTFFIIPPQLSSPPPIGRPVSNSTCYVLDSRLQPVPIGVPGELYIGGDCLARGYLNRPDLTKERFMRSPFSADPEARIYKTGDLVRYLPDGNLEFLGRVDLQVKIRGFRIELGEIESVLAQHVAVSECVVEVREPKAGNKQLVAYVTWRPEFKSTTVDAVKMFLKEALPEYMVPSAFVIMEQLPLTANGKVDRRNLPEPDWRATSSSLTEYVAPTTPTQISLATMWATLLGMERVGIHDNFFELGGHSLTAAVLLSRIRDEFHVEVPIAKIFDASTVEKLAAEIDSMVGGNGVDQDEDGVSVRGRAAVPAVEQDLSAESERVYRESGLTEAMNALWQAESKNGLGNIEERLKESSRMPTNVFLTGASGYLGAFLLKVLLQKTRATIHCLVRVDDPSKAVDRIHRNLKQYNLIADGHPYLNRIMPVVGDLSKPLLGLSPERFDLLSREIDVIYHCGAFVNSILPYSHLKNANVLGTIEALRLATRGHLKPFHHISTLSVFPDGPYPNRLPESTPLTSSIGLHEGYAQSKWVADKVVLQAHQDNIPVVIYRPGRITGDQKTGVASIEDFMCRMTKGCLQMEMAPDLDWLLDMTPVDFVSQAIVHLSQTTSYYLPRTTSPAFCPTYHLCNPSPLPWPKLIEWLRSFGYAIRQVPYTQWRERLLQVARDSEVRTGPASRRPPVSPHAAQENALLPLIPIFGDTAESMGSSRTMPHFDTSLTQQALQSAMLVCPPVSSRLLVTYFRYYIRCGFLTPPQRDRDQFDMDVDMEGEAENEVEEEESSSSSDRRSRFERP